MHLASQEDDIEMQEEQAVQEEPVYKEISEHLKEAEKNKQLNRELSKVSLLFQYKI